MLGTLTRPAAAPAAQTFAAFFIANADCLSPAEKAQALQEAAEALLRDPTVARGFNVQLDLMALGDFLPAEDDTPEFICQRGAAACSWGDFAFGPGVLLAARELSDAAQALAEKHELCMTHWCWVGDCDHAADAADRAHDRYRTEGCD